MNTKEAIKILKRENYLVEELENGKFHVLYPCENELRTLPANVPTKNIKYWLNIFTGRELVKLAREYTSENNRRTAIKKDVKHFDHRKNRNATRQAIVNNKLDKIPQNGKVKEEDVWSWD